ncbi:MAG TPA: D-alanine--D-alanine ligase [Verrucomicrobiae bacterium]|nr:D-alanine--D-alanine ligase [Verrucomicrobiae bacterium]
MTIGILYCKPPEALPESPAGNPDDEDVIVEVIAVEGSLRRLGRTFERIYVEDDIGPVVAWAKRHPDGIVFNLCESFRGSNLAHMNMPALLELLGLPYTGSTPLACGLTTHKFIAKSVLAGAGLPTPESALFSLGEAPKAAPSWGFPAIVKPLLEDASVGIDEESVVRSVADLAARVAYVHERYFQAAIVERYVHGREINIAVVGNDPPRALPLSEIEFHDYADGKPRVVGYRAKWVHDSFEYKHTKGICPADVPAPLARSMQEMAVDACRAFGCRDYARVDFRLDESMRPFILEVNANPDITDGAGLARACRASDLGYDGLIRTILDGALARAASRLEGVKTT